MGQKKAHYTLWSHEKHFAEEAYPPSPKNHCLKKPDLFAYNWGRWVPAQFYK